MAKLKDKIQNVLDESRMLILGAQVLLGFQYRSAFESGFEKLSTTSQYLKLGSLLLMLLAVALLISPSAYHRIVARGEDTEELHQFSTDVLCVALLPFALALGLDLYVAAERIGGQTLGTLAGLAATVIALFYWYGLELWWKKKRQPQIKEEQMKEEGREASNPSKTELRDKIKHVLTEARVVLPGAQALLGFQFTTILMESFEKLPTFLKYAHLASLAMIALAVILLMTPAAYHRIVEYGEETQHFHRFATQMVLAAMIPLALGIVGDLFVVMEKITQSHSASLTAAGLMLTFFYGFWFGFTVFRRGQQAHRPSTRLDKRQVAG